MSRDNCSCVCHKYGSDNCNSCATIHDTNPSMGEITVEDFKRLELKLEELTKQLRVKAKSQEL